MPEVNVDKKKYRPFRRLVEGGKMGVLAMRADMQERKGNHDAALQLRQQVVEQAGRMKDETMDKMIGTLTERAVRLEKWGAEPTIIDRERADSYSAAAEARVSSYLILYNAGCGGDVAREFLKEAVWDYRIAAERYERAHQSEEAVKHTTLALRLGQQHEILTGQEILELQVDLERLGARSGKGLGVEPVSRR